MFEIIEDSGIFHADRETAGFMIESFFERFRINADYTVTVIMLDDAGISAYNRDLFNRDNATDVISVLMEEEFDDGFLWGEIYVSSETAERESQIHGTDTGDEILLYIVHGLFHLLGYTDETDEDREHMWSTQIDFLAQCGINAETFMKG